MIAFVRGPVASIGLTSAVVEVGGIGLEVRSLSPEPDVDEVYDHVTRTMQETLDALAAERRLPIIG